MQSTAPIRLCISDLHLDDSRPDTTQALIDLLAYYGERIVELYILGDLFNYWAGDDCPLKCAYRVSEAVRTLPFVGWVFGNRDFLLGTGGYFAESGMTALPEVHHLTMAGKPTLLCHGDQLCSDDTKHQEARLHYTSKEFQRDFLAKDVETRLDMVKEVKLTSKQHKQMLPDDIMDVTQESVEALLATERADILIHGHTHRPALHQHTHGQRLVLGEWAERGWCLIENMENQQLELASFAIPFDVTSWQTLATLR